MGDMKKCSKCKEVKDFSEFHKLTKSKDGHQSKCKLCRDKQRPANVQGKSNRSNDDLEGEIWEPVQDFEDSYQISNKGRVRSLERKVPDPYPIDGFRIIKASILKVTYSSEYPTVRLTKENKSQNHQMHILMYKHFGEDRFDPSKVIDHRNNDKSDFSIGNLQQISNRYNTIKDRARGELLGTFYIKPRSEKQAPKWEARIRINGKRITLGRYNNPSEAHKRYLEEYQKLDEAIPEVF